MTITDSIALLFSIFLLIKGARRGFLGSLLGPVALILSLIVSFVYYILTKDLRISLCINLFGPLILGWVFRSFLKTWTGMTNAPDKISIISRILGAIISSAWGLALLIITIILLSLLPPLNKYFEYVYQDIHRSKLYSIIKPLDHFSSDKTYSENDISSLSQDKRIQEIINDPQIIEAINSKDYAQIMSNPKITAIVQDPALMKKMLGIYRQMMQEKLKSQEAESK